MNLIDILPPFFFEHTDMAGLIERDRVGRNAYYLHLGWRRVSNGEIVGVLSCECNL